MNDVVDSTLRNDMLEILNRQKRAYIAEGEVSAAVRIDRLDRSVALLKKYGPRFCTTMAGDFGHRSIEQSKLTDVDASIGPLRQAKKHVKDWMKPEKRSAMFPLGRLAPEPGSNTNRWGLSAALAPGTFLFS